MLTIRAMSDGQGYSSKHLEHSDYYAEGERVMGQWRGHGAELLGLSGEVKSKEFEFLRQACHPETGVSVRHLFDLCSTFVRRMPVTRLVYLRMVYGR
jgi:hypothetical protein